MKSSEKFSSKMDPRALKELRAYAKESNTPISVVIGEAVQEYLAKVRVRPAFRTAAAEVLDEHKELLERLAK